MQSIISKCASDNYHILVSADVDDESMEQEFNYPNTTIIARRSKNKIDAINRDLNEFSKVYDWDILVNMSDDMVFIEEGFDDVIRAEFWNKTPIDKNTLGVDINLDQCLHFPDGNRNDLITMAIMGREYYNRFNYIYHPDYKSLYCDNDMTDVSKALGCYKYVNEDILRHLHPAYAKGSMDAQYVKTEAFSGEDQKTYNRRKSINFEL